MASRHCSKQRPHVASRCQLHHTTLGRADAKVSSRPCRVVAVPRDLTQRVRSIEGLRLGELHALLAAGPRTKSICPNESLLGSAALAGSRSRTSMPRARQCQHPGRGEAVRRPGRIHTPHRCRCRRCNPKRSRRRVRRRSRSPAFATLLPAFAFSVHSPESDSINGAALPIGRRTAIEYVDGR